MSNLTPFERLVLEHCPKSFTAERIRLRLAKEALAEELYIKLKPVADYFERVLNKIFKDKNSL